MNLMGPLVVKIFACFTNLVPVRALLLAAAAAAETACGFFVEDDDVCSVAGPPPVDAIACAAAIGPDSELLSPSLSPSESTEAGVLPAPTPETSPSVPTAAVAEGSGDPDESSSKTISSTTIFFLSFTSATKSFSSVLLLLLLLQFLFFFFC
eukprot:CAMPEP_0113503142 /NCGR_PEP_ID=MMETSP0014_2-20120614/33979_1 /TAXON_ID=2857 /ORGANISM="Nitzschia sp." /LENGTH=151 /DNA_ID=CAMNT_0000398075 /DNA_START=141 /DNA_END=596 /DNA_ORIENTATION=+ /assembly_acc=CAM_ASM_000159